MLLISRFLHALSRFILHDWHVLRTINTLAIVWDYPTQPTQSDMDHIQSAYYARGLWVEKNNSGLGICFFPNEMAFNGFLFESRSIWRFPKDCCTYIGRTIPTADESIYAIGQSVLYQDITIPNLRITTHLELANQEFIEKVTIHNPPPNLKPIRTCTISSPIMLEGSTAASEAFRIPLTRQDILYHRDLGYGYIQGIVRGVGTLAEIAVAWKSDKEESEEWIICAIWIPVTALCLSPQALPQVIEFRQFNPDFTLTVIPDTTLRVRHIFIL